MIGVISGDHSHTYAKVSITIEHVDGVAHFDIRLSLLLKPQRVKNKNY